MKILLLHTDSVQWEPKKKAIKQAEEVELKPVTVKEALVVLTAVERLDEADVKSTITNGVKNII